MKVGVLEFIVRDKICTWWFTFSAIACFLRKKHVNLIAKSCTSSNVRSTFTVVVAMNYWQGRIPPAQQR